MNYTDFFYGASGTASGAITSFDVLAMPVHAVSSPANLYLRVTGIAQAITGDPPWGDNPPWMRGTLQILTDQVLEPADKLLASCATAGFAHIERDENGLGSSDDWGLAIDEVALVQLTGGAVALTVHCAYYGDAVIPAVAFSADLLIYRPALDDVTENQRYYRPVRQIRSVLVPEGLVPKLAGEKNPGNPIPPQPTPRTGGGRSFTGSRERPLHPEELAARRPIVGSGERPPELQAMIHRQTIFVGGEERERPDVAVHKMGEPHGGAHESGWRIDITYHQNQRQIVYPRLRTIRDNPKTYRNGIKPDLGHSGRRPAWIDLFYQPRLMPRRGMRRMYRLNGKTTRPLWVFGPDDRKLYQDASYPWGCIGSIVNSDGVHGSGALVGRNLVVTAGHMIPWNSGGNGWLQFVPADYLGMGSLFGKNVYSYAVEARGYDTAVTGYDWAILKLDQPLGDMVGYMGYNSYSDDWEDVNCWTIVGYPSGVGPFWQGGISVNDDDEDSSGGQELESETADVTGGDSGGPMFAWWDQDPRIVGVVSGEETEYAPIASSRMDNVIASGPGLMNLIAWGRSNW